MGFLDFWRIDERLERIEKLLLEILARLPRNKARRIVLGFPTAIRKGTNEMADIALQDDLVYTIPILTDDGAGNPVPAPAGDVFTVASSSPSLTAAIGATAAGAPAIILTPTVLAGTGYVVTVTDSAGLAQDVATFDITQDQAAKSIALDFANETTVSQPAPTNPGP